MDFLESFQNEFVEFNTFDEFLNMGHIIRSPLMMKYSNQFVPKQRRRWGRQQRLKNRFNPMRDLGTEEFMFRYRFTKENMKRVVEMIKEDLEIEKQHQSVEAIRKQVPVENQIMGAIRYWARTEHPEITAQCHGITLRTLMKISKRVAEAFTFKASRYIRMPCLLAEKEKVTKAFYDLARMPQIIGAVTHAKIKCKRLTSGEVHKTKPEEVLHIQIVSDAHLKIRDLDCHLTKSSVTGNKTSSDVFAQSRIKERFEQNEFRGRLLLGDSEMKCSSHLYTPVAYAITAAEEAFNNSVRLTYEPARQCLNLWQKRFGILHEEFHGSPTTIRHIIVALVLLHNMALEWGDKAIDANNLVQVNNSLLESNKTADEQSRAEFIKNHFSCMH